MKNLSEDPLVRLQECRGDSFIACKVDESCGQAAFDEKAELAKFESWYSEEWGFISEFHKSSAEQGWLACAKSKAEGK